ncbi:MAG: hypothetical protein AB1679_21770 [Actinomycetota bacterium]|jgi:ABC-type nickel/cobalt efflux system permease component RcnA
MLAYHFHDLITRQFVTSLLVLLVAVVLFMAASRTYRSEPGRNWLLAGLGILVAAFGLYRLAEVPALHHNHLCHAHNSDSCTSDHAARKDDHTHWFGGRAAEPR